MRAYQPDKRSLVLTSPETLVNSLPNFAIFVKKNLHIILKKFGRLAVCFWIGD